MTTSGSRGGRTRRAPPLTTADLWFFNAQNAYFSHFFPRSLRSQFILSLNLIDIWSKHAKIDFYFKPSTLSMICYPPPPLTKSTPLLRSNPGSATDDNCTHNHTRTVKQFRHRRVHNSDSTHTKSKEHDGFTPLSGSLTKVWRDFHLRRVRNRENPEYEDFWRWYLGANFPKIR